MSEREEIKKRVQNFRAHQERLTRERDARMNKTTQEMRKMLSDLYGRDNLSPPIAPTK
jgi:hypothetical protein